MRRLAIFGSTGSIGKQTLGVVRKLNEFEITALTAGKNWELLVAQAKEWKPKWIAIKNEECYKDVKDALFGVVKCKILTGDLAGAEIACDAEYDLALNGLVGVSGLLPSFYCLNRGINLALANKESLVLAGKLLLEIAREKSAQIIPVDSEHSAIFQCLHGEQIESIYRIILTASGGPFLNRTASEVYDVKPEEALAHPVWKMGPKITIDSATLMNKGFEVIEAHWLFDIPPSKIEVYIHPVSVVHSMVQFVDGSIKAQLGKPDMHLPIQFALSYPKRLKVEEIYDDPVNWPKLDFYRVDMDRFKCLRLAYNALEIGGSATAVLNGADEAAVESFLLGKLKFGLFPYIIEYIFKEHKIKDIVCVEDALEADRWGREMVKNFEFTK